MVQENVECCSWWTLRVKVMELAKYKSRTWHEIIFVDGGVRIYFDKKTNEFIYGFTMRHAMEQES